MAMVLSMMLLFRTVANDMLCFAYDKFDINSEFILRTWDPQDVKKSSRHEYLLYKEAEYYQYRICAKILDMKKDLMTVYGIMFIFDSTYPPDVKEGDYIVFTECRMDVLHNTKEF